MHADPTTPDHDLDSHRAQQAAVRPPRTHTFFWAVLIAAAAVSITGNALHALLHAPTLPMLAAAVAVIPPLALLAAVHGVALLLRAHARARGTHLVATAMTALIAAGAFWLSFTALRALAVTAGIPAREAWLWPLIIEGSMAQATVALLALAHSNARTTDTQQQPGATGPKPAHPTLPTTSGFGATTSRSTPVRTPARGRRTQHAGRTQPKRVLTAEQITAVAYALCARDRIGRRDPDLVAKALTHHHIDGWNPTRIAAELDRSRSTISRILRDADICATENIPSSTASDPEALEDGNFRVPTAPVGTTETDSTQPAADHIVSPTTSFLIE
ncbi:DUF2637 domain-containing protein [Nocardia sp. NPDC001965]